MIGKKRRAARWAEFEAALTERIEAAAMQAVDARMKEEYDLAVQDVNTYVRREMGLAMDRFGAVAGEARRAVSQSEYSARRVHEVYELFLRIEENRDALNPRPMIISAKEVGVDETDGDF